MNEKVVVFGGMIAAVVFSGVLLFIAYRIFFGDTAVSEQQDFTYYPPSQQEITPIENTAPDTPASQPVAPTPFVEPIVAPSTDWRQSVVTHETIAPEVVVEDMPPPPAVNESFVIPDITYVPPTSSYMPPPRIESEPPTPAFTEEDIIDLDHSRYRNCGEVFVPTNIMAQLAFFSGLDNQDAVICLGENVADNCRASYFDIEGMEDADGSVYLARNEDDVCSIGFGDGDEALLCEVEASLEAVTGEDKTWSAWVDDFEDDPGGMIELLIKEPESSEPADGDVCGIYRL